MRRSRCIGCETFSGLAGATVVEPASVPQIARDPDDDHVLACALEAKADLIVTGDADLLTLKTYQNISIVSTAEALRRV